MQRDLFGQLLRISLEKSLDIDKVLMYPLTPMPFSLCHADGSICKTDKSILVKILEKRVAHDQPQNVDTYIYDGFFMLHLMREIPLIFGHISEKFFKMCASKNASTVIINFDQYFSPSIKDTEHLLRGSKDHVFHITGSDQRAPSNFHAELKNINFKKAIVEFFIQDWENDHYAPFLGVKNVYINYDKCYKYEVINGKIVKSLCSKYTCSLHEEADTKIVHNLCAIDYDSNVVIRCSDTDILIILLGNMEYLKNKLQIWMHLGVGNHQRFINVTKLYNKLGEKLSKALPAFHAFTGCDFNPAFYRKGKKRPLTILEKSEKYIDAFIKISDLNNVFEDNFEIIQEYTCEIYGFKKIQDVNEARVAAFNKTYKFDNKEQFPTVIKNIDGSTLPPCQSELEQHLKRTGYISHLWRHSHLSVPIQFSPVEYGWEEVDNKYIFKWFEGDEVPQTVSEVSIQNELDEPEGEKTTVHTISIHILFSFFMLKLIIIFYCLVPMSQELTKSSDDEDEDDNESNLEEEEEEQDICEETSEYDTDTSSVF